MQHEARRPLALPTHTALYVNARDLFGNSEQHVKLYNDFFCRIATADDPYLTFAYLEFLQGRMEEEGVTLPPELVEVIDATMAAYPGESLYIELEAIPER